MGGGGGGGKELRWRGVMIGGEDGGSGVVIGGEDGGRKGGGSEWTSKC